MNKFLLFLSIWHEYNLYAARTILRLLNVMHLSVRLDCQPSYVDDEVSLPLAWAFDTEYGSYLHVVMHELAHSTGEDYKLDREYLSYASEEYIAETAASLLCKAFAFEYDYIAANVYRREESRRATLCDIKNRNTLDRLAVEVYHYIKTISKPIRKT